MALAERLPQPKVYERPGRDTLAVRTSDKIRRLKDQPYCKSLPANVG